MHVALLLSLTSLASGFRFRPAARAHVMMKGADPYSDSFLTMTPVYNIDQWELVQPLCDRMVSETKKASTGVMYAGYDNTRSARSQSTIGGYAVASGDELFFRLAFSDASGLLAHLDNILEPLHSKLLAGPAALDRIELHGPAEQLDCCKAQLGSLGTVTSCPRTFDGLSRIEKESGGMPLPMQILTVHSTFELADREAAEELCNEIVARTVTEENVLHCGWSSCGTQLHLREGFGSVIGIARHVENVGSTLDKLTEGPAVLVGSRLHTSVGNFRTFDEYVADTERDVGYCSKQTKRCYLENGISRYEVQQSMFGFFLRR